MGARVAVGAGCALLAACLAGTPLLISSSASGAVQLQVEQTCGSDLALTLPFGSDESEQFLDSEVDRLQHVEAPRVTKIVGRGRDAVMLGGFADGLERPAVLINTDGQESNVVPALTELAPNEIAMSRQVLDALGLAVGDTLTVTGPGQPVLGTDGSVVDRVDPGLVTVTVAAVFDDLGFSPAPAFWCGLSGYYGPTPSGDLPRKSMILASPELTETFDWFGQWEVRLSDVQFTRRQTEQMRDAFARVIVAYADYQRVDPRRFNETGEPEPVATVVDRAESLASAVPKAIAPVRIVGALTALLVLVAAAVMLARERRRELRLLALRGQSPWRGSVRLVRLVGLPVIVGSAAGFGLALLGIRALGPDARARDRSGGRRRAGGAAGCDRRDAGDGRRDDVRRRPVRRRQIATALVALGSVRGARRRGRARCRPGRWRTRVG